MLNSILLLLFFAFRRKTKHQQHLSSSVPLWGWIFVGAVAALGLVLLLRKKRAAQQESAGRVPVAVPSPSAAPPQEGVIKVESEPAPAESRSPSKPDDLTKISGIGPKIQLALNEEGIYTYQQLAEMDIEALQVLMKSRNWYMATYTTWPQQARDLAS